MFWWWDERRDFAYFLYLNIHYRCDEECRCALANKSHRQPNDDIAKRTNQTTKTTTTTAMMTTKTFYFYTFPNILTHKLYNDYTGAVLTYSINTFQMYWTIKTFLQFFGFQSVREPKILLHTATKWKEKHLRLSALLFCAFLVCVFICLSVSALAFSMLPKI